MPQSKEIQRIEKEVEMSMSYLKSLMCIKFILKKILFSIIVEPAIQHKAVALMKVLQFLIINMNTLHENGYTLLLHGLLI